LDVRGFGNKNIKEVSGILLSNSESMPTCYRVKLLEKFIGVFKKRNKRGKLSSKVLSEMFDKIVFNNQFFKCENLVRYAINRDNIKDMLGRTVRGILEKSSTLLRKYPEYLSLIMFKNGLYRHILKVSCQKNKILCKPFFRYKNDVRMWRNSEVRKCINIKSDTENPSYRRAFFNVHTMKEVLCGGRKKLFLPPELAMKVLSFADCSSWFGKEVSNKWGLLSRNKKLFVPTTYMMPKEQKTQKKKKTKMRKKKKK